MQEIWHITRYEKVGLLKNELFPMKRRRKGIIKKKKRKRKNEKGWGDICFSVCMPSSLYCISDLWSLGKGEEFTLLLLLHDIMKPDDTLVLEKNCQENARS